jgi:hypothetical protein
VKALATRVHRKKLAKLRFDVSDNSSKSTVTAGVYRRNTRLRRFGPEELSNGGYYVKWRAPAKPQRLSFCVSARDAAGNQSPQSCAAIRVT